MSAIVALVSTNPFALAGAIIVVGLIVCLIGQVVGSPVVSCGSVIIDGGIITAGYYAIVYLMGCTGLLPLLGILWCGLIIFAGLCNVLDTIALVSTPRAGLTA